MIVIMFVVVDVVLSEGEGIFLNNIASCTDETMLHFQLKRIEFNQQVDSCYVSSSWHFNDYY